MKWGLVPSWSSDPSIGNHMINARVRQLPRNRAIVGCLRASVVLFLQMAFMSGAEKEAAKFPFGFT
jgi:putative SOS response-associated peptidase YedK